MNEPTEILFHCTDVSSKKQPNQFFAVNRYHRDVRKFPISSLGYAGGYHKIVTGGRAHKYREDWEIGAHCNTVVRGKSMNAQSLGLGWGGDGDIELPNGIDRGLIREEIKEWQMKFNISNEKVKLHREYAPWKTCPGSLISTEWLQALIKDPEPQPEKKPEPQLENQVNIAEMSKTLDSLREMLLRLQILIAQFFNRG